MHLTSQKIRLIIFIACGAPFVWLGYALTNHKLGINPFESLMVVTAHSGFIMMLLSLSMTPLRRWLIKLFRLFPSIHWGKRLSDWNILIKLRRMFGLFSFFYISAHAYTYLDLELNWIWDEFVWELKARGFLIVGLICWLILMILAVTSLKSIQKKMRKWWRRTHRLVYPLSILACLHFLWAAKETNFQPYYYWFIVLLLLSERLIASYLPRYKQQADQGMEIER